MSTISAGVPKLRLTLPTTSPKKPPSKINTHIVLNYWLKLLYWYFPQPGAGVRACARARVCVCACSRARACVCVCLTQSEGYFIHKRCTVSETPFCCLNSSGLWTWTIKTDGIETACLHGCNSAVPFPGDPPNVEEQQWYRTRRLRQ